MRLSLPPRAHLVGTVAVAVLAVLFGPWWDIGFEDATLLVCVDQLRDELAPVGSASQFVPPGVSCVVEGRTVGDAQTAGGDQLGFLLLGAMIVAAAAWRRRVAAPVLVLGLIAVTGFGAYEQVEAGAPFLLFIALIPMITAVPVHAGTPRAEQLRRWGALTAACWVGYFATAVLFAMGVTVALAAAAGLALATVIDRWH